MDNAGYAAHVPGCPLSHDNNVPTAARCPMAAERKRAWARAYMEGYYERNSEAMLAQQRVYNNTAAGQLNKIRKLAKQRKGA